MWQLYNILYPLDRGSIRYTRFTIKYLYTSENQPNSVRIRFLCWQIFVLPSAGFELTIYYILLILDKYLNELR